MTGTTAALFANNLRIIERLTARLALCTLSRPSRSSTTFSEPGNEIRTIVARDRRNPSDRLAKAERLGLAAGRDEGRPLGLMELSRATTAKRPLRPTLTSG